MINQQLVDYVKQQVQAGISKDAVRKALGDAGWPSADIDDSLKAAEPISEAVAASPVSQATINPAVAMGGVDVMTKSPTTSSSSDKFFAKPAATSQISKDNEHSSTKKLMVTMIAMGVVILLLAGALAYVYFNLNSQLTAALTGNPGGDPTQTASLQQQVTQLTADKNELTTQKEAFGADNQVLLSELGFFVPPASATSTAPASAIVKGTLFGNASTTFALMTAHNVRVVVLNSKDAKVAAALTPLVGSTSTVTLAGTHHAGSLNLTVTAVNGAPL